MQHVHTQIPFTNRFLGSLYFILQHILQKSERLESWRKKNSTSISSYLKNNYNTIEPVVEVPRLSNLSENSFVKNYLNAGLPVIFESAAKNWPCTKKWSLDFLKQNYPDDVFSLIDSAGLVESIYDKSDASNRPKLITKMTAKDFVDAIQNGENHYLRFCPIMETHPELEHDLDQNWLKKMRRCFLGISYQTFIGPSKRKTPLHAETTAFFYIMADGEKKWTLFSPSALSVINPVKEGRGYNYSKVNIENPDLELYPGINLITRFTCHLKKGDILFVPAWMWHEVENVKDGWGLSYRFTSLRGFFKYPGFFLVRLFLTKPNFLEILYYSFFRSDITNRNENLLTPKIFLRK